MKSCYIFKTVALIATKKSCESCLRPSHATVPSSQFFQVRFEGSWYKQASCGLGAWATPNMRPLTGKPGQELRAVVGGSFPSSTVPRSGKYQKTEKVLDWGARESCNRIICVLTSLSFFRSLLMCRSTPLRILCCGGACSTSWWHVLSSCFVLDITYPLSQQTSP